MVVVPVRWQEGLRCGVRLLVLGVNPLQRFDTLNSWMGTTYGVYPWVSALVMGNLMGRRFGWVVDVFFWAGWRGEEKASGHVQQGRFSLDDTRF
jgi:hypothetical protein